MAKKDTNQTQSWSWPKYVWDFHTTSITSLALITMVTLVRHLKKNKQHSSELRNYLFLVTYKGTTIASYKNQMDNWAELDKFEGSLSDICDVNRDSTRQTLRQISSLTPFGKEICGRIFY